MIDSDLIIRCPAIDKIKNKTDPIPASAGFLISGIQPRRFPVRISVITEHIIRNFFNAVYFFPRFQARKRITVHPDFSIFVLAYWRGELFY